MLIEEECILDSFVMDSAWNDVCLNFTAEAPSRIYELCYPVFVHTRSIKLPFSTSFLVSSSPAS